MGVTNNSKIKVINIIIYNLIECEPKRSLITVIRVEWFVLLIIGYKFRNNNFVFKETATTQILIMGNKNNLKNRMIVTLKGSVPWWC